MTEPVAGGHRGLRNFYRCPACHFVLVTLDVDEGATPLAVRCRNPGCQGWAPSAGYPEQWPDTVPTEVVAEWYRPSPLQQDLMKRHYPNLYRHVRRGGLILRAAQREVTQ